MDIAIRLDDVEMRAMLARYTPIEVAKILRVASTAAGAAGKAVMRPAIPLGLTGNLRGSLSAKRIRANPAIGVVVGPMGKKASARGLVAGGTKPHTITGRPFLSTPYGVFRSVHHPGAKPNRWLDGVAGRVEAAEIAAAEAVLAEMSR